MSVITIEHVELQGGASPAIRAFSFDRPQPGTTLGVYDIEAFGWVLPAAGNATGVTIHSGTTRLRNTPLDQLRVDVARAFPDRPEGDTPGWRTSVNVVGLEPNQPLQYAVKFEDGESYPLAQVHFSRQRLRTGFTPRLQPLMLTTLGRAGTTWMMRVLAEHPGIVVHRQHPYELRIARHWLHSFKILTEPRDLTNSAHADTFANSRSWAGHNPFYPIPLASTPGLKQWYGKTYVEEAAFAAQRWIDEAYIRIAAGQGEPQPVYFAEKHRADLTPWLVWELYDQPREIFLVRDFRDVISSMLAFNKRHGRPIFGPKESDSTEADFARYMQNGPIGLIAKSWAKRQERALLIRYEDLIETPVPTLRRALSYLTLDASDDAVHGMLDRASADNPEMRQHKTSDAVATSIGRWRTSLSPEAQIAITEVLENELTQFGYEL